MRFLLNIFQHYINDSNHVIDWTMIQVEPEGEFHPDALRVLDMKEKFLQNQSVMQVKLQWKHFGVDEATWELEYAIRVAYPFFFYV
jgi:hypothetical protein